MDHSKDSILSTALAADCRRANTLANINFGDPSEVSSKVLNSMGDSDVAEGGGTKDDLEALTQSAKAISNALTLARIAARFFLGAGECPKHSGNWEYQPIPPEEPSPIKLECVFSPAEGQPAGHKVYARPSGGQDVDGDACYHAVHSRLQQVVR